MARIILFFMTVLTVTLCRADLIVTQSEPKTIGNKLIVLLKFKNTFAEPIQSARAACFLLDDQGKMVGQSTKWVIGQNKTGLEPNSEVTFNFVITSPLGFTSTNMTAKVSFSQIVMVGDKFADVRTVRWRAQP